MSILVEDLLLCRKLYYLYLFPGPCILHLKSILLIKLLRVRNLYIENIFEKPIANDYLGYLELKTELISILVCLSVCSGSSQKLLYGFCSDFH